MSAGAGERSEEWDELAVDGADSWVGTLLLIGSGIVSLKLVEWLVYTAAQSVMP